MQDAAFAKEKELRATAPTNLGAYNPQFIQLIFSFRQNSHKITSGKLSIPLLCGMILRRLPAIE